MDKAQAWYLDVVMAIFIFMAGIVTFHYFSINVSSENRDEYKDMSSEIDMLSSELLKEGYPDMWTANDVVKIGLTNNDQRIDERKWIQFSSMNYNVSKEVLATTYDFLVFIENAQGNVTPIGGICGIGFPKANFVSYGEVCSKPILPTLRTVLKRERFVFVQGEIRKLEVYLLS